MAYNSFLEVRWKEICRRKPDFEARLVWIEVIIFLIVLLFLGLSVACEIRADSTVAIIGGFTGSNTPYAAFIQGETVVPLDFPSGNGGFGTVAINSNAIALLGGSLNNDAYAALVSGTTVTPFGLPGGTGTINVTAINNSSVGLFGGLVESTMAYAALVEGGTVVPISLGFDTGSIYGAAINNFSVGLISGKNQSNGDAYAAIIQGGIATSYGLDFTGYIGTVAINDSSTGIIGGANGSDAYLASIQGDTLSVIPLGFTTGYIIVAAINNSSIGIIGGQTSSEGYAAFLQGSSLTPISTLDLPMGQIASVAINNSQSAIIAGSDSMENPYSALVAPDMTLTVLDIPILVGGNLASVAINDAGLSIIGGQDQDGNGYAALVSPLGAITVLNTDLPGGGEIGAVAMLPSILSSVTPTSAGPYGSPINSLLATSFALQGHMNTHHKQQSWKKKGVNHQVSLSIEEREELIADANDEKIQTKSRINSSSLSTKTETASPYCFWFTPFNDYINLGQQGSVPAFVNEIAGGLVALDCRKGDHVFGGGFAYAFNYAQVSQSLGHSKVNEEVACLFESFQSGPFFVNGTIWGGGYQLASVRHSGFGITSTGKSHGWLISPHLEISGVFYQNVANWFIFEPFGMADWVNNWQAAFTESGASGLNLSMPSLYSSLLRTEAGLRFYETLSYGWGRVILEQKASYINQAPFHVQTATTFFVGSASTFSVVTGSSSVQNLAGVELHADIISWDEKYPYGAFDFQGEFGSSFQSYFVSAEIGKRF